MNIVEVFGYSVVVYVSFLFLQETKNCIKNALFERRIKQQAQMRLQKEEKKEQAADKVSSEEDVSDLLVQPSSQFLNVHTGKRIFRLDYLAGKMMVVVRECLVDSAGLVTYSKPVLEQGDLYSVSEKMIRKK